MEIEVEILESETHNIGSHYYKKKKETQSNKGSGVMIHIIKDVDGIDYGYVVDKSDGSIKRYQLEFIQVVDNKIV